MYVVNSTKWDASRVVGQERLLADAWLEAVSDDCSPTCWPPLFSVVQLLRNLVSILNEIDRGTLRPYHLKHGCEELLARLDEGTWLDGQFIHDMSFLKEKLRWARDRTKETADDVRARSEALSFLKAFVNKVEASVPWKRQIESIADHTGDASTRFQVIIRAVGELTNDLMHKGHSRAHLNRWILKAIVRRAVTDNYLELFRIAPSLHDTRKGFEVLLQVASPERVIDSSVIGFSKDKPADWALDPDSVFLKDARSRYAIVQIERARDGYAAIAYARAILSRYLWSMKFHHIEFDRALSKHAAVREIGATYVNEDSQPRHLDQHTLWNSDKLEAIDPKYRNHGTFHALDRILYWIEQTRRVEPVAALISEWTALEFLFSVQELRDLDAVEQFVPAYLAPKYPRLLLVDFWKFLLHIRPSFSDDLKAQIEFRDPKRPNGRPTCNFVKLLEACLEEDATNPIRPLVSDYPLLIAKWRRVCRLKPGSTSLTEDVEKFRERLVFDIRTCYRARNTVVHDAAMTVSENLRMLQRLNWMLCTCVDQVLFMFSRNTRLSMIDLHRCTSASWHKWQEVIEDNTSACSPEQVVNPPIYFTI